MERHQHFGRKMEACLGLKGTGDNSAQQDRIQLQTIQPNPLMRLGATLTFKPSPTGTYSASGYVRDGHGTPAPRCQG